MNSPTGRHVRGIDLTLRTTAITVLVLIAATVLRGAAAWLHRRIGLGVGWCLAIVVVALVLLTATGLWLQGPRVSAQAVTVADAVTKLARHLWELSQNNPLIQRFMPRIQAQAGDMVGGITAMMPGVASSALGAGGDLVVILATAIFLAASPTLYVGGFLRLLPRHWRPRGLVVLDGLTTTLRLWFLGQFADMVLVAVLTGIGLFLLGVPLSLTLALIAGLFNFVPYIGALAGAVPALAVAIAVSPQTALYVAILFAIVQTLEGNVIAPLIQKRTVDLPPALTILSQTVLGTLFGIMGLILATPLTAATVVAVRMIYVETVLEGSAPTDTQ